MANTIAICTGVDNSGRSKRAQKMGGRYAVGQANTYATFTTCTVWADGHGEVEVKRNGSVLHSFRFGPENEPVDPNAEGVGEGEGVDEGASPTVRQVIGG